MGNIYSQITLSKREDLNNGSGPHSISQRPLGKNLRWSFPEKKKICLQTAAFLLPEVPACWLPHKLSDLPGLNSHVSRSLTLKPLGIRISVSAYIYGSPLSHCPGQTLNKAATTICITSCHGNHSLSVD